MAPVSLWYTLIVVYFIYLFLSPSLLPGTARCSRLILSAPLLSSPVCILNKTWAHTDVSDFNLLPGGSFQALPCLSATSHSSGQRLGSRLLPSIHCQSHCARIVITKLLTPSSVGNGCINQSIVLRYSLCSSVLWLPLISKATQVSISVIQVDWFFTFCILS